MGSTMTAPTPEAVEQLITMLDSWSHAGAPAILRDAATMLRALQQQVEALTEERDTWRTEATDRLNTAIDNGAMTDRAIEQALAQREAAVGLLRDVVAEAWRMTGAEPVCSRIEQWLAALDAPAAPKDGG